MSKTYDGRLWINDVDEDDMWVLREALLRLIDQLKDSDSDMIEVAKDLSRDLGNTV